MLYYFETIYMCVYTTYSINLKKIKIRLYMWDLFIKKIKIANI
jgi:hypothetical protein